jgi:hypothetical protein
VRPAVQRVLVREVQVATGEPNVEPVGCLGFPERPTVTGAGVIRGPSFAYDFETWRPVGCSSDIRDSGCCCVGKDGS